MSVAARYEETITLPRAVRFPVELVPPDGFAPDQLATWPRVAGRLEVQEGRLLYLPPCGDDQQDTVTDVVITLGSWVRQHPEFVLGTNEAGMRLGGATRAADAAIWRRSEAGPRTGGLRLTPPVLAAEVGGQDEPESMLRDKARWYLEVGVILVWLVLPETREVVEITVAGERRFAASARIPERPDLPGLSPQVASFFVQIADRAPAHRWLFARPARARSSSRLPTRGQSRSLPPLAFRGPSMRTFTSLVAAC